MMYNRKGKTIGTENRSVFAGVEGTGSKGMGENVGGIILDLHCGGGYMTECIYQNLEKRLKKEGWIALCVNYTLTSKKKKKKLVSLPSPELNGSFPIHLKWAAVAFLLILEQPVF